MRWPRPLAICAAGCSMASRLPRCLPPHATTTAYARLTAMKLYAYRAMDYLQAASADDRRYLLFNAVQKGG